MAGLAGALLLIPKNPSSSTCEMWRKAARFQISVIKIKAARLCCCFLNVLYYSLDLLSECVVYGWADGTIQFRRRQSESKSESFSFYMSACESDVQFVLPLCASQSASLSA